MKNISLIAIACIVGLLLLAILFVRATQDKWWHKNNKAIVLCDGKNCPSYEVYISQDGKCLLRSPTSSVFLIDLKNRNVWLPNVSNYYFIADYAYSRFPEPSGVLVVPGKAYEPNLFITGDYFEFDSINDGRVRVSR